MKTGTSCTRCSNAKACPSYDPQMAYGFCQGFEPEGEQKSVKVEKVDQRTPMIVPTTKNAKNGANCANKSTKET